MVVRGPPILLAQVHHMPAAVALGTRAALRDRLRFEGYRSGHMMYLREEDRRTANDHLRSFIESSIPEAGTPAKYGQ